MVGSLRESYATSRQTERPGSSVTDRTEPASEMELAGQCQHGKQCDVSPLERQQQQQHQQPDSSAAVNETGCYSEAVTASGSGDDGVRVGVGVAHRVTNIVALTLLVLLLLASVLCVTAGACCLASLHGKPFARFAVFFTLGVGPVVVGGVLVVCICTLCVCVVCSAGGLVGVKQYGMCCLGTTRVRAALRVCLYGVLPFVLLLIVVVLAVAGFVIFNLSQQLPDLHKDYVRVNGLRGPVDITRDAAGLTHIRARSRHDAYFAQGFAEAQDRLFQLEFHRLVAKGELASMAGRAALETDKAIRTLNVRDAGLALCANMDSDLRNLTQAFADGVNVYLQRERKRPVEFFFLGPRLLRFHEPTPFSYLDVCLTGRLFQWQMSSNMALEHERFNIWLHSNRSYSDVDVLYADLVNDKATILNVTQMTALMTSNNDIPAGKTSDDVIAANVAARRTTMAMEEASYNGFFALLRSYLHTTSRASADARSSAATRRETARSSDGNASAAMDPVRNRVRETLQAWWLLRLLGGNRLSPRGARTVTNSESGTHGLARSSIFANKFIHASNAWATRDAAGHAIVASDAHLTTNLPSVWYYTHMSFPASTSGDGATASAGDTMFDAAGVSLIGLPGVHIGRTNTVAWGITMSMTDLEDLYLLPRTRNVAQKNSYVYNGRVYPFSVRSERIQVKGSADVVLQVRDTILGPVVNDLLDIPAELTTVLSAVPLRRDDATSMRALLGMTDPAIDSADKMMQLLLTLQAPGFSIPIADVHGNVAYAVTGRHPLRNADHTGKFPTCLCNVTQVMVAVCAYVKGEGDVHTATSPCVITDSDLARVSLHDVLDVAYASIDAGSWSTYIGDGTTTAAVVATSVHDDVLTAVDRFVPTHSNPHVHIPFDASAGVAAYIVAANHKIMPAGYTYHLGDDYAWSYRGRRITEMLTSEPAAASSSAAVAAAAVSSTLGRGLATHERIQLDHRSNFFVDDVATVLQSTSFQRGIADDAEAMRWLERLLRQWPDAQATLGSVEAAFFWRWMQRMSSMPHDALDVLHLQHWPTTHRYLVRALTSPTERMKLECARELTRANVVVRTNDDDNEDMHACIQFAAHHFKQQVAAAKSSSERWGVDVNHLRGIHELLQGTLLAPVFEREIEKAGDESSVCVSHHSLDSSMLSTQASSMRLLFDMNTSAHTLRFALPGGQSGNPYSDYYNNMLDKYAAEQYLDAAATSAGYAETRFAAQQTLSP